MTCLCCADDLLRHASQAGVYWFCPTCRQRMPAWEPTTLVRRSPKLGRHG